MNQSSLDRLFSWKWRALIVALAGLLAGLGYRYAEPKISLFEEDRVRENFRNMKEVFPSRAVQGSSTPRALESRAKALDVAYEIDGQKRTLGEFLKRSRATTLLVLHEDAIVHEWTAEGYSMDDHVTSFSVVKSFVATLVGIALDRKLISSLDDPISDYVPGLLGSGFDGVPIAHVLEMSSGVDFSERYDDKTSDAFTIFDDMFIFGRGIDSVAAKFPSKEPSGERFQYASINTHALAMLVRSVAKEDLSDFFQGNLWEPLGAEKGAYFITDLYQTEIAFWGLSATPRDFAKLGQLYLHEGELGGRRIVSREWIERSTTPQRPDLERGQIDGDWGYGYHWWLPRAGQDKFAKGDYAAIGIWGQMIYVNPAAQLVAVKTSADPDFKRHEYETIAAFRATARTLTAR